MKEDSIVVRKAGADDAENILRLVRELAEFEKLDPPDDEACYRLIRDAFGDKPLYYPLLAEINGKCAGYAFYFFTYSSFLAKPTLYLEDIYISRDLRNRGIGRAVFNELKRIAAEMNCGRMEWVVLDWNINAIRFYEREGAEELTDWKTFRLTL